MDGPFFERYKAADGWRYRLRGENGEVVLPPESFTRAEDVDRAIAEMVALVVKAAPQAPMGGGGEPVYVAKIVDSPG